jgi:hypothetical protein
LSEMNKAEEELVRMELASVILRAWARGYVSVGWDVQAQRLTWSRMPCEEVIER